MLASINSSYFLHKHSQGVCTLYLQTWNNLKKIQIIYILLYCTHSNRHSSSFLSDLITLYFPLVKARKYRKILFKITAKTILVHLNPKLDIFLLSNLFAHAVYQDDIFSIQLPLVNIFLCSLNLAYFTFLISILSIFNKYLLRNEESMNAQVVSIRIKDTLTMSEVFLKSNNSVFFVC